jgi:hypothetical protein
MTDSLRASAKRARTIERVPSGDLPHCTFELVAVGVPVEPGTVLLHAPVRTKMSDDGTVPDPDQRWRVLRLMRGWAKHSWGITRDCQEEPPPVPLPTLETARILASPPTNRKGSFWLVLEVVDGPHPHGTRLCNAFARRRLSVVSGDPWEIVPREHQDAIAKLMAWAHVNGWHVGG